MTKTTAIGTAILAGTLVLPMSMEAQGSCHISLSGGTSFAATGVPLGDDRSATLDGEGGVGFGFDCGRPLAIGVDVEVEYTDIRGIIHVLAGVGPRIDLGAAERAPWLQMTAQAGFFSSRQNTVIAGVGSTFGQEIHYEDEGPVLAGRLRFGLPVDERWAFFAAGSVRVLFISTTRFPEGSGTFAETRIPIAVGLRLTL